MYFELSKALQVAVGFVRIVAGVGVNGDGMSEIAFCGKGVGENDKVIFSRTEVLDKGGFLFASSKYPDMLKDIVLKIATRIIKNLFFNKKNFNFEKKLTC